MAIFAIILGQAAEKATQGLNLKSALFLFCVWAGYAAVDILLKYSSSLGLQFAVTLNLIFIVAFVLSIAYLAITQPNWQPKNIFAGLVLGAINFANIALIPGGVRVYFQPYQVAPWSAGTQIVDIPLEKLKDARPLMELWGRQ